MVIAAAPRRPGCRADQLYFNIEKVGQHVLGEHPDRHRRRGARRRDHRPMRIFAPGFGAGAVGGYAVMRIDPAVVAVQDAPAPGVAAAGAGPGGSRAPAGVGAAARGVHLSTRTVRGADGTALRAWCNDGTGPPVLLCNGLGAPPEAWPRIVARGSGYRVVTWYQRGLGGSERPADPSRVRVEDHADDARAVLDAFDVPAATVIGWSLGVNVAFELALQDPARVLRRAGGRRRAGWLLLLAVRPLRGAPPAACPGRPVEQRPPARRRPAAAAARGEPAAVARAAVARRVAGAGQRDGASRARCVRCCTSSPATTGAGSATWPSRSPSTRRWTSRRCAARSPSWRAATTRWSTSPTSAPAAGSLPGARLRELPGTHFLPLQYPAVMLAELRRIRPPR